MLGRIRKHSVKIIVFAINICLAAAAVFIIREKDQPRLLEKFQKDSSGLEAENSAKINSSVADDPGQNSQTGADSGAAGAVEPSPDSTVANPIPVPVSAPVAPPVQKPKPSNAKTKTS
ncbi:MAG: hypothetical protein WC831_03210 [Parcubacteria group bacterium]|jgi:hypothetical protein